MQMNAKNMSIGAQVAMPAVKGGTAEKLGGGKFANGAVTGAYVMMFNHLGEEVKINRKEKQLKALAMVLHTTEKFGGMVDNPFYGAEAIFIDYGGSYIGQEIGGGYYFLLAGEDAGTIIPFKESGTGVATDFGAGGGIGRVDLMDKSVPFQKEMLFGERTKIWAGVVIGVDASISKQEGVRLISTSISIGRHISPFWGIGLGFNEGLIKPKN
jgi:hypothetical protein